MGLDFKTRMYGALPLHGILASSIEATPQHLSMKRLQWFLTATIAYRTFQSLSFALAAAKM
eukprot:15067476-Ditylum_brightwellii.AAC.1